jgi:hypothetical protein
MSGNACPIAIRRDYFERRLFDKLLVCEGEHIEELLLAAR